MKAKGFIMTAPLSPYQSHVKELKDYCDANQKNGLFGF